MSAVADHPEPTGLRFRIPRRWLGAFVALLVVPAMLRVNWSPWFSSAAGASVGFIADLQQDPVLYGVSVGPEWSLLSMCAGDRRQYEISFSQGLRFGHARNDFHQSVVFTYLLLD